MERRFLGIKQLAEYLGVKEGTVYAWVFQKKIPYLKIGKLVKFDVREIEAWLEDKRIKEFT